MTPYSHTGSHLSGQRGLRARRPDFSGHERTDDDFHVLSDKRWGASKPAGFTLVEILISISIMALATTIATSTFFVISRAYQHGTALTENLHYGDFLMDQLVLGLRSAHHPDASMGENSPYGFWLEDGGSGPRARDRISWVKTGWALIGDQSEVARVPHRIEFGLETDRDGQTVAAVKAWRTMLEPEDFDAERLEPMVISRRIMGFECRFATNVVNNELVWESDWEATNRIPPAVELTLYLEPIESGAEPIKMRRVVGLPIAPLSWQ